MSYSIRVVVKDGQATVESATAPETLADGVYVISGHIPTEGTWQSHHIQVTRFEPNGSVQVVQASATAPV